MTSRLETERVFTKNWGKPKSWTRPTVGAHSAKAASPAAPGCRAAATRSTGSPVRKLSTSKPVPARRRNSTPVLVATASASGVPTPGSTATSRRSPVTGTSSACL